VKQKEDGIFINQDKYVAEIIKKFGLTEGKSASTPIDIEKPLLKDPDGEDVDVHIYRSMIGSLMYLTLSRPDIMFAFWSTAWIETTKEGIKILATVDGILRIVTESSLMRNLKFQDEEGISSLPDAKLFENLTLMGYNISPNQKFTFQKDEPASPLRDVSKGEACPTDSGFGADQDRENIAKTSTLPYDSAPRVTSPAAEGRAGNQQSEHNVDFHPMVDFIEASPLRYSLTVKPTVYISHIRQFWSTASIEATEEGTKILTTMDGIHRTVTESSLRRNLKLQDEDGISEGSGTPTEPRHTPSPEAQPPSHTTHSLSILPPVTTTSIPTITLSKTTPIRKYTRRARIAQSSALLAVADNLEYPLRDVSQGEACPTDSGFIADQDRATIAKQYSRRARIAQSFALPPVTDEPASLLRDVSKAAERVSDDTEEMATVLTFMDAATVLASGVADVPIGSRSIPTAGPPTAEVPTGSDVVARDAEIARIHAEEELQSLIDGLDRSNETVAKRRKGKEIMVESETPKKKKEQEQIDAQVARDLEEQMAREDQRMSEQVAIDAKIARIHAEEELQSMIDGLDRSNETTQQRKPWSKKQKRDYYMAVIKSKLGWKVKDFRGMTFEEIEAKFTTVWKQLKDFIPMGSKEEAERLKRKGLNLEQESEKKLKTSDEVPEEVKSPDEVPKEKVKEMMQLVPIEEVYVEALQVKHSIIDWKHMDREDLNQLWALVKESLSNRQPTSDKEIELWVELKRLYEPDDEDEL
nr:hypothetical protein [Tanacetum cinerariifolium]